MLLSEKSNGNVFCPLLGVLQGDPLAPFLFIICLDYAMRSSIVDSDGVVLKRRRSRRHPPQVLSDLDYADDIALIEATNHRQGSRSSIESRNSVPISRSFSQRQEN